METGKETGTVVKIIDRLLAALEEGDFEQKLREHLIVAEKKDLEDLVLLLTSELEQMKDAVKRGTCVRGIQSVRAVLKIRFTRR